MGEFVFELMVAILLLCIRVRRMSVEPPPPPPAVQLGAALPPGEMQVLVLDNRGMQVIMLGSGRKCKYFVLGEMQVIVLGNRGECT